MPEQQGEGFVMRGEGPIDFSTFVLGLASTVLIHLGHSPHPETQAAQVNLTLAKQTLDLLDLLREKTRNNLSVEEEKLFSSVLTDLKLRYVQKNP